MVIFTEIFFFIFGIFFGGIFCPIFWHLMEVRGRGKAQVDIKGTYFVPYDTDDFTDRSKEYF